MADPDQTGDRPTRTQQYQTAVEEYRFQTTFNWSRTQYLLAFNAGILAAAVAVAGSTGSKLSVLVFALGIIAGLMTAGMQRVQHEYYRRTRNRMQQLARDLEIPPMDTTATMAGVSRLVSVQTLIFVLLGGIVAANAVGIVLMLVHGSPGVHH